MLSPEVLVGQTLGSYRLHTLLGVGELSAVYRATADGFEAPVALKVFLCDPTRAPLIRKRFGEDLQGIESLEHPHFIKILEVGILDDLSVIAMELVEGGSLEDELAGHRALHRSRQVVRDLASILAYLHSKDILHFGLRPGNVLVGSDQQVKLLEPGVVPADRDAVFMRGKQDPESMRYLAPELIRGQAPGAPWDMYGLGLIAYQLLLGRLPYEGTDARDWATKIARTIPERPSVLDASIPDDLDQVVMDLLQKDPGDRPTARDVGRRLSPPVKHPSGARRTQSIRMAAAAVPHREDRRALVVGAMVLLIVSLIAILAFLARSGPLT